MNLRNLGVLAVALVALGCTTSAQTGPQNASSTGPQPPWPTQGRYDFEGIITYKGRSGPPPGEPMDAVLYVKGDRLLMNVNKAGTQVVLGYNGSNKNLCVQFGGGAWIPINLATVGWLMSLLPPSMRRSAAQKYQSQHRWTGRTEMVAGRPCREMQIDDADGKVTFACYSTEAYFGGDYGFYPILKQMGYDDTFLSSYGQAGIGWKIVELEKGQPSGIEEAVAIEWRPLDPRVLANVCQ